MLERALVEYQQAVQLDPTNQYAAGRARARAPGATSPSAATASRRHDRADEEEDAAAPGRSRRCSTRARTSRSRSTSREPVSIFEIYRALGKAFGINILFDPNLRTRRSPSSSRTSTAQAALETLMRAASHFYKVIDEHTIIIAADTPQNRRTYEDLVIQTFFLSNAEVKDMMTILRSLVDAKKIATNEQLNAIILRDTADKVKVAERIIEANDKSQGRGGGRRRAAADQHQQAARPRRLALRLLGSTPDASTWAATTTCQLRISDLEFLNQSNWVLTIPNFIYNFVKTERRRPAPGQAAAAHHRGREGAAW